MGRKSCSNRRHEELIPVVYARNLSEAEFYRSILEDRDIPVVIEQNNQVAKSTEPAPGIPVLVPKDNLSEAQDIIEQRNLADDELEAEFEQYRDPRDEAADYDGTDRGILETEKIEDINDEDYL